MAISSKCFSFINPFTCYHFQFFLDFFLCCLCSTSAFSFRHIGQQTNKFTMIEKHDYVFYAEMWTDMYNDIGKHFYNWIKEKWKKGIFEAFDNPMDGDRKRGKMEKEKWMAFMYWWGFIAIDSINTIRNRFNRIKWTWHEYQFYQKDIKNHDIHRYFWLTAIVGTWNSSQIIFRYMFLRRRIKLFIWSNNVLPFGFGIFLNTKPNINVPKSKIKSKACTLWITKAIKFKEFPV